MHNCYIDVHIIQTLPPSCVNRDDVGSPKTATYGGAPRARVSSPAWKHAMREYFRSLFPASQLGFRTRHVDSLIEKKILGRAPGEDPEKVKAAVDAMLATLGIKAMAADAKKTPPAEPESGDMSDGTDAQMPDKEKKAVLFFISDKQAEALAALYEEVSSAMRATGADSAEGNGGKPSAKKKGSGKGAKKGCDLPAAVAEKIKRAVAENPSVDIALFGRMLADNPSLQVEASAQVAHAISTHRVETEYDYFTAVDDFCTANQAGAGHIGTVEFNSSTLYRYASVNVRELADTIGAADTPEAVRKFIRAFALSMPTGRQNAFANQTVPDMVYVAMREDCHVSFAPAFEKPVRRGDNGYIEASEHALLGYAAEVCGTFVDAPRKAYQVGGPSNDGGIRLSLKGMLDAIGEDVESFVKER